MQLLLTFLNGRIFPVVVALVRRSMLVGYPGVMLRSHRTLYLIVLVVCKFASFTARPRHRIFLCTDG